MTIRIFMRLKEVRNTGAVNEELALYMIKVIELYIVPELWSLSWLEETLIISGKSFFLFAYWVENKILLM